MPQIICPNCQHSFEPEDAISKSLEAEYRKKFDTDRRELRTKYVAEMQKLEDEKRLLEEQKQNQQAQIKKILETERQSIKTSIEQEMRKSISSDFENKLRMLEDSKKDSEEKLKLSRQKELEYLQKENDIKRREEELDISVQKKLVAEREKLAIEIRNIENQKLQGLELDFKMRLAEKDKQLDDQKKLAEEMKRKAEQGSMQLQGEVQELALEELLRNAFPFDVVKEVGKGVRGADCIQTVRNNFGQECGNIIYESKRTSAFSNDWIEKLKTDMRSQGAEIAVLVTQNMPKDMSCFGLRDGIWICTFSEVQALSGVLRDGVLRIFGAAKSQQNKGDKMHLLYDYLTGNEFAEQWQAVREVFIAMRQSIHRERDAMERLWKSREKQLDKALINASRIKGSIDGISGEDNIQFSLMDDDDEDRVLLD